jgi:NAD(P)H-dependent FMN reductase
MEELEYNNSEAYATSVGGQFTLDARYELRLQCSGQGCHVLPRIKSESGNGCVLPQNIVGKYSPI